MSAVENFTSGSLLVINVDFCIRIRASKRVSHRTCMSPIRQLVASKKRQLNKRFVVKLPSPSYDLHLVFSVELTSIHLRLDDPAQTSSTWHSVRQVVAFHGPPSFLKRYH